MINPRDFSIYQPALSRREHDERGKIHIVKKIIINIDIKTIDVLFFSRMVADIYPLQVLP